MKAYEAMTKNVIAVGANTPVREIAALLVRHRISAVPVVSEGGRVIGIVSQTDLGHRSETDTEKRRKWWLEVFADSDSKARDYIKSHGNVANDVMTRLVVSVSKDAQLSEVAEILDTHRIRQVPVMEDGSFVGMISRADLVRKLAEATITPSASRPENGVLQKAIWHRIKAEGWVHSALVNIVVNDGVVELWGAVASDDQRRALHLLVEGVNGVRRVEDHVGLLPKVTGV
jgi:CBS domain-containing protein